MSKGRDSENWTTFDVAGLNPLRGAALVSASTHRGSFLAFPRWGEMRTPVFAHITRKIRHFVSATGPRILCEQSP